MLYWHVTLMRTFPFSRVQLSLGWFLYSFSFCFLFIILTCSFTGRDSAYLCLRDCVLVFSFPVHIILFLLSWRDRCHSESCSISQSPLFMRTQPLFRQESHLNFGNLASRKWWWGLDWLVPLYLEATYLEKPPFSSCNLIIFMVVDLGELEIMAVSDIPHPCSNYGEEPCRKLCRGEHSPRIIN